MELSHLGWIFGICLFIRLFQSLTITTYFNPDEYWQNQEVAYDLIFGNGFKTWEWQPYAQIRSYTHPLTTAAIYKFLASLNLDTRWLIAWSPRIFQACLNAVSDCFLYLLVFRVVYNTPNTSSSGFIPLQSTAPSRREHRQQNNTLAAEYIAKWTLCLWLFLWFPAYCFSRPFSNSIETALTIISLYYWPFLTTQWSSPREGNRSLDKEMKNTPIYSFPTTRLVVSLSIAALTILFRPTAAILWIPLGLHAAAMILFTSHRFNLRPFTGILTYAVCVVIIGVVSILALIEIDSYGYLSRSTVGPTVQCVFDKIYPHITSQGMASSSLSSGINAISHFVMSASDIAHQCAPTITLSLHNFYKINKTANISSLYGELPPFFSMFVAIPVSVSLVLPFLLYMVYQYICYILSMDAPHPNSPEYQHYVPPPPNRLFINLPMVFFLAFFLPFFYSFTPHQEYRFILPAVPFLLLLSSYGLCHLAMPDSRANTGAPTTAAQIMSSESLPSLPASERHSPHPTDNRTKRVPHNNGKDGDIHGPFSFLYHGPVPIWGLVLAFTLNALIFFYFQSIHQSGSLKVMDTVHEIADLYHKSIETASDAMPPSPHLGVAFITSCHSAPFASFVHSPHVNSQLKPSPHLSMPDCSPLFFHNEPCRLHQVDQLAAILGIQPSTQALAAIAPRRFRHNTLRPTHSIVQTPRIPGRHIFSEHSQVKNIPVLYFWRRYIYPNLLLAVFEHASSLEGVNDIDQPAAHDNDFYHTLEKALKSQISTLFAGGDYSKTDFHSVSQFFAQFVLNSTTPSTPDTVHSEYIQTVNVNELLATVLRGDLPHISDQHMIHLPSYVPSSHQRISYGTMKQLLRSQMLSFPSKPFHRNHRFLSTVYKEYAVKRDPLLRLYQNKDYSFPLTTKAQGEYFLYQGLSSETPQGEPHDGHHHQSEQDHPFPSTSTWVPDIVIVFNQEHDAMLPLLQMLDYTLFRSVFHSHLEPEEHTLFVYIHSSLASRISLP